MTTQESILQYCKEHPNASLRDIAAHLNITHSGVDYHIRILEAAGKLERVTENWKVK